jgi:hypothetical protein
MALVLPLVLGLAVAPLLGGRWSLLGGLRLRALPLFYGALALQLAAFPTAQLPWRTPDRIAVLLWLASYTLFAVALALNARIPGVPLVAIGLVSNVAAIVSNGGHMPALPGALRAAGMHFEQSRNSVAAAHPNLVWFVDRWAAPHWLPWGNVFSVGDIAIALGGLVFALAATGALGKKHVTASPEPEQLAIWQLVATAAAVSVVFVPFGLASVVTAAVLFPLVAGATAWVLVRGQEAARRHETARPTVSAEPQTRKPRKIRYHLVGGGPGESVEAWVT